VLQFENSTPFSGMIMLFPDADGIDTLYTVIKGAFTLDGRASNRVRIADEQVPITLAPEFHGEPGLSSLKVPSDISLEKPAVDIVIMGHAWAPEKRPVSVMDVGVRVGPVQRIARVFGNRVWRYTGVGFQPSEPEPFQVMPLVWERAFGGKDVSPQGPIHDARNPAGTGFRVTEGGQPVEGVALPNIENPLELITTWNQQPTPMGFAPIDASWEPRRSYAGTYDERWEKERSPYLPADFDPRFLQIGPPELVAPQLRAGEWVDLRGFTPAGVMQYQLPLERPRVTYRMDGDDIDRPAPLDTVIIEPDLGRTTLVWRAALRCDKKALRVSEVEVNLVRPNQQ
jgi:hypothetical protein